MKVAAVSHRGRRDANDDVVFVRDGLVVLADGMGGHAGGRQAALTAIGAALGRLTSLTEASLREAFNAANVAVREYQLSNPDHGDAGCTLTVVFLRDVPAVGRQAVIGHAGDSPTFLVRGNDLTLLTPPHTVAEHLRREGKITEEQASSHPGQHTLQRSVGGRTDLEPEIHVVDVRDGDRLLVCSDGLLDVSDRRRLREIACGFDDPATTVEKLAAFALASSTDNVTVAVLDTGEGSEVSSSHDG